MKNPPEGLLVKGGTDTKSPEQTKISSIRSTTGEGRTEIVVTKVNAPEQPFAEGVTRI